MAEIVVDSAVMRDKAKTMQTASSKIQSLYNEMLQEVNATAGKMKGTTIETQQKQFAQMQSAFETISADVKNYAAFLEQAAENYELTENNNTQKAAEQGKVF